MRRTLTLHPRSSAAAERRGSGRSELDRDATVRVPARTGRRRRPLIRRARGAPSTPHRVLAIGRQGDGQAEVEPGTVHRPRSPIAPVIVTGRPSSRAAPSKSPADDRGRGSRAPDLVAVERERRDDDDVEPVPRARARRGSPASRVARSRTPRRASSGSRSASDADADPLDERVVRRLPQGLVELLDDRDRDARPPRAVRVVRPDRASKAGAVPRRTSSG